MCGIVGYVGPKPVLPVLMEGLRNASSIAATIRRASRVVRDGQMQIRRSAGKLSNLEDVLAQRPHPGRLRHRTHALGDAWPSDRGERASAPRLHGRIVVVHNGIIENYLELKRELTAAGHTLRDRDGHGDRRASGRAGEPRRRARRPPCGGRSTKLRGLFALVLISADDPGHDRQRCATARRSSSGLGDDEFFVASDIPAILEPHARDRLSRRSRDRRRHARRRRSSATSTARPITKTPQHVSWDPVMAEKAGYPHFMLKEIHEQPWAVRETVLGPHVGRSPAASICTKWISTRSALGHRAHRHPRLRHVVACRPGGEVPDRGTGARAGRGRLQLRVPLPRPDRGRQARWPLSSRSPARRPTRWARCARPSAWARAAIAICNVVGSMATREADGTVYTHAGPEIGVASTKAFTSPVGGAAPARDRDWPGARHADPDRARVLIEQLEQLPVADRAGAAAEDDRIREAGAARSTSTATFSTSGAASTIRSRSRAR